MKEAIKEFRRQSEEQDERLKSCGAPKCPRCYHYSWSMNFDGLCNRCVAIITKHHPDHQSITSIIDNLNQRGMKPQDNPEWDNI